MEIATTSAILQGVGMASRPDDLIPPDVRAEMRPEAIGHRMRLLREALGMRPAEIADMLDIERTYWSRFEGGKRKLTDEFAALLVSRFGVTLDFLILGRWDKFPLDLAERMRSIASKPSEK